jgi:hypothetical protein
MDKTESLNSINESLVKLCGLIETLLNEGVSVTIHTAEFEPIEIQQGRLFVKDKYITDILVQIDELKNDVRLKTCNVRPIFELRMHKHIYDKFNKAISWMARDSFQLHESGTTVSDEGEVVTYMGMNVIVDNSFPFELAVVEV